MPKSLIFALLSTLALVACEGHSYEPPEPGVTISGTAGVGVIYKDGKVTPENSSKITVSLGGSI